jgi:hypothetical protein
LERHETAKAAFQNASELNSCRLPNVRVFDNAGRMPNFSELRRVAEEESDGAVTGITDSGVNLWPLSMTLKNANWEVTMNVAADIRSGSVVPIRSGSVTPEQLYSILRDYICHEDDLIHQRTTWFTAIQNFTLVTFGYIYASKLEGTPSFWNIYPPHNTHSQYIYFLCALALFGIIISLLQLLAVWAAQRSIDAIQSHWEGETIKSHFESLGTAYTIELLLPAMTGGGGKRFTRHGHNLPLFLPIVCLIGWLGAGLTVGLSMGL